MNLKLNLQVRSNRIISPSQHTSYAAMEKDWWNQKSPNITMKSNGEYLTCSDKKDSTGYSTYRKNGDPNGECWAMDFEEARRDYDGNGSCKTGSKLCMDSLVESYVC